MQRLDSNLRRSKGRSRARFFAGVFSICTAFVMFDTARLMPNNTVREVKDQRPTSWENRQHVPSPPVTLPFLVEGEFEYAKVTYRYRYSTKLLQTVLNNEGSLPRLVYGVCSTGARPFPRRVIRESWAQDSLAFFLVGGSWSTIEAEFQASGDLLWFDMPEDYKYALTPKTMGFIHFALTQLAIRHNYPLDYMFKTDSDVYVNATEMSLELDLKQNPEYYGLGRTGSKPVRDATEGDMKWYVSTKEYPFHVYPSYAIGVGYALSKKFAACAVERMKRIMWMPWEDVATGMLALVCNVSLTTADDQWSHFLPLDSSNTSLHQLPFDALKDGGQDVKILHKVPPQYFVALSQQKSLVAIKEQWQKKAEEYILRKEQEN